MATNKEIDPRAVGQRILELCQKLQWTQARLATVTGITESSISNFVSGARVPSTPVIHKIASALCVSVEYLLTGVNGKDDVVDQTVFRDLQSLDPRDKELIIAQIEAMKKRTPPK